MLEDQDTHSLILGELDNASAHQMGNLLICVSDFARSQSALSCSFSARMPVLARLRAMRPNCRAPCAGYLSATADEAGGQDRTFDSLDGADCEMFVEVQIDRTDSRCGSGSDLCLNLWGALEVPLNRNMQPPLLPSTRLARDFPLRLRLAVRGQ